ncbi:MAG: lipoate--protein ligase family protein [Methanomassiliicoccaceae archaeon]|jgi:lipoate-protein ligase A|nr:lipoate--protein ligase family protein [Methanomassiliicoccaceae archaeon]
MRYIDLGSVTPEYSVCVDKVILDLYSQDMLVIYSRDRPCVSVGRSQKIDDTVDLGYVNDNDIAVVRRVSGGSNIYSDSGQLTYSLIVSRDRLPASRNDSFAAVCGAVVAALKELGIDGSHKPVNDILVNGKKISGGAQARNKKAVLQHGSLILDVDNDIVRSSLIDTKKRTYGGLTSVKECLGYIPSRERIVNAIVSGFSEVFGNIEKGTLTDEEKEKIEEISALLLVQVVHVQ